MISGNKLKQLRMGIPAHKNVILGSGDNSLEVSVVALSADTMMKIEEQTENYMQTNKDKVNESVKMQYMNILLAYNCMRDPSDDTLKTKIAQSVDDVREILDMEDIARVINAYGELMINKAPKIELLTQEQLDLIKKHLEVTPLSDLSTVLLVHLASCHQTIVSEI